MKSFLENSRFLILLPILGSLAASVMLILFGLYEVYHVVFNVVSGHMTSGKQLVFGFIEMMDLFLMGTVFYIISMGLYELFIDDALELPNWLKIKNLDDLKEKLIAVVIVVMAVLFLGQVVTWDGQRNLLYFGGGIGAVIASLTWFLSVKSSKRKAPKQPE